ncbi:M3 family oligoendopeptidase [Clostridium thermarum]|uniref:M3 family oligoendopeptidase n=1 Tax=Clostridium thermarum TaxID=1716543 RepID=UPI0013D01992|nr:M3 family oligoendopeptidase [Clostridium thermarum]
MNFNEFKYTRANIPEFQHSMKEKLSALKNSKNFSECRKYILEINKLREDFLTNCDIAKTRYNMNTADSFYSEEVEYINNIMPLYEELVSEYYKLLISSPFIKEIENEWGNQLIQIANLTIKTFSPEIIEDLKEENKLANEYSKLMASAKIIYNNEEYSLSGIGKFTSSQDRETRKSASEAKYCFFIDNAEKLDELYDSLVKVRTTIAHKLGYKNYVELGYARMLRSSYNADDVKKFRDQITKYIVPLSVKLRDRQKNRLQLESLKYYDETIVFPQGNPKPIGNQAFIEDTALDVFKDLSAETGEFFAMMKDSNLMDLEGRKNKRVGGYCTYFYKYKAPFIFTNFNGNAGDVKVLAHESGHAFQAYLSRESEVLEYISPTLEACEIHSMSMEYFIWPWVEKFFGEGGNRYKFEHLSGNINNLCYMACVDEFQHMIYENPNMSPSERKSLWRSLEIKYLPHRDYEDNCFLEEGGYWQQQRHIYIYPFYYIDYALAQICALQFWKSANDNRDSAWSKYIKLCKAGGSQSFADLVKLVDLKSPFENDCIKTIINDITSWFDSVSEDHL